jgi:hypothetical protein
VRRSVRVSSRPRGVSNHGGEALAKCSKGRCICLHAPYSSRITPSTSRDTTTVSKMGHTVTVCLPMLRVRRQNPPDKLEPPRVTRVRDEATQRVVAIWHIRSPIKGTWRPQASYLSLDWRVSFTPLYGLTSSRSDFLRGLPGNEA